MKKFFNSALGGIIYFLINIGEIAFYSAIAYLEYKMVHWLNIHAIWVFILWVGTILAMGNCILQKIHDLHEEISNSTKNNNPKKP